MGQAHRSGGFLSSDFATMPVHGGQSPLRWVNQRLHFWRFQRWVGWRIERRLNVGWVGIHQRRQVMIRLGDSPGK